MFVKHTMNKLMVLKANSPAIHKLGDIRREMDDFINVYAEDGDEWIGMFEEGFGFADVKFKKTDCRTPTKEEIDILNTKWYTINGNAYRKNSYDYDGNWVEVKSLTKEGTITSILNKQGNPRRDSFYDKLWNRPVKINITNFTKGSFIVIEFTDDGSQIRTSTVEEFHITPDTSEKDREDGIVIYTRNTVYYIKYYQSL